MKSSGWLVRLMADSSTFTELEALVGIIVVFVDPCNLLEVEASEPPSVVVTSSRSKSLSG